MPPGAKDSLSKWIIPFSCCFVNFILDGLGRLSGILLVATLETFPANRESAALPFNLCTAIRNLSSPLVGLLGAKYGIRWVTVFGGILSSLGVGLCFFAPGITWMTVSWGVVFAYESLGYLLGEFNMLGGKTYKGIGYGFGNILLPVAINEHFDVNRATASGISFSGGCLGSLVLPVILQLLLDKFGLHGLCLMTSGLILNCIPAALLLRSPDPHTPVESVSNAPPGSETLSYNWRLQFESDRSEFSSSVPEDIVSCSNDSQVSSGWTSAEVHCNKTISDVSSIDEDLGIEMSTQSVHSQLSVPLKFRVQIIECTVTFKSKCPSLPCRVQNSTANVDPHRPHSNSLPSGCYDNVSFSDDDPDFHRQLSCGQQLTSFDKNFHLSPGLYTVTEEKNISTGHKITSKDVEAGNEGGNSSVRGLLDHLKILTNVCFLCVTVLVSLYEFVFIAVITIIIDFSKDLQISEIHAKWLLAGFSIGDIFGRLCLGWITDKKIMSRHSFTTLCFLGVAISITGISYSSEVYSLIASFFAYGVFESGALIMFPLLIAEHVNSKDQTVAIAVSNFLPGLTALAVPSAIGIFRDAAGSYKGLFYALEAASVMSSALCLSLAWMASKEIRS